jgi:hypothetical protein
MEKMNCTLAESDSTEEEEGKDTEADEITARKTGWR